MGVFAALAVSRWIEAPDRLVDPEVRPHRPPLPHHRDPGRRARHYRRRPPPRRPPPGPRPINGPAECALTGRISDQMRAWFNGPWHLGLRAWSAAVLSLSGGGVDGHVEARGP